MQAIIFSVCAIEGYSLSLKATNHVALEPDFHDEWAWDYRSLNFCALHRVNFYSLPDASLRASRLIASGIELYKGGASVTLSQWVRQIWACDAFKDCSRSHG